MQYEDESATYGDPGSAQGLDSGDDAPAGIFVAGEQPGGRPTQLRSSLACDRASAALGSPACRVAGATGELVTGAAARCDRCGADFRSTDLMPHAASDVPPSTTAAAAATAKTTRRRTRSPAMYKQSPEGCVSRTGTDCRRVRPLGRLIRFRARRSLRPGVTPRGSARSDRGRRARRAGGSALPTAPWRVEGSDRTVRARGAQPRSRRPSG